MADTPKFDPADYLDGGNKALKNNDYASLKGLDGEKIKQIALARIAAKREEAVTIQLDQIGAPQILEMINPFDKKDNRNPKNTEVKTESSYESLKNGSKE